MNGRENKKGKIPENLINRLNRSINIALTKFNQENDLDLDDMYLINIYKKVNKSPKSKGIGRSNPVLWEDDFTELEGLILTKIAEHPTTRRELAFNLNIQASSVAGIVGGKLLKFGWVEVVRYRKCTVTHKTVQELSITEKGKIALANHS
ncbi:hypothetical protein LEP1GSC202_0445 [Leptospira yanagawae serovar Saopaulo str. Sao Paulo = ATCC 700523]|uniref:Uncharacterized protein n=1 Tax=Leptospira yanagawae serovar Saopaulo str. Sao Paulo = ATCC 700523 TaxID=1249483 RepID=A0A5E8HJG6_9LEPT|nr:MarR family transcriptional regulator [Leptospira yanagawae]EOQ90758.1 hypothetical protein LEP1GSC202_0445 [Leptospira yanagawae serovar Saopaulo str. Sao Paulo = ATCC 700523]